MDSKKATSVRCQRVLRTISHGWMRRSRWIIAFSTRNDHFRSMSSWTTAKLCATDVHKYIYDLRKTKFDTQRTHAVHIFQCMTSPWKWFFLLFRNKLSFQYETLFSGLGQIFNSTDRSASKSCRTHKFGKFCSIFLQTATSTARARDRTQRPGSDQDGRKFN